MPPGLTRYSGVLIAASITVLGEQRLVVLVGSVAIGVLFEVADGTVEVAIRILRAVNSCRLEGQGAAYLNVARGQLWVGPAAGDDLAEAEERIHSLLRRFRHVGTERDGVEVTASVNAGGAGLRFLAIG